MEDEMVEDNVNEEEMANEYSFTAYEIDLDYEFDADRFFDFSRAETPLEARLAEVWFESAPSYPPSPFVAGLVPREQILLENINISPKSKGVENMNLCESDSDVEVDHGNSAVDVNNRDYGQDRTNFRGLQTGSGHRIQNPSQNLPSGLTFYNHMVNNKKSNNQTKLSMKPSFPRTSTLMKPTASQLAKQNRPIRAGYSRSNASALEKTDKSSSSNLGIENQAAKRQKLDGGLQRKMKQGNLIWDGGSITLRMELLHLKMLQVVVGGVQLQQTNFVHKAAKKDVFLDGNITHAKPRITIPREPDLETAHRAQRIRPKSSKEAENVTSTVRKFKALPLNRKIFEGPSLFSKRSTLQIPNFQEFHLKTSERAIQHSSAITTPKVTCNDKTLSKQPFNFTTECGNREPARPSSTSVPRPDGCESSHGFKALPLNKKILTSKGDIGVFRNNKKETTVPMEFSFQMGRKLNNPLSELFNKLSLASATKQVPSLDSKLPHSIDKSKKGSKENNRLSSFQPGNEIKQLAKSKLIVLGGKQQI